MSSTLTSVGPISGPTGAHALLSTRVASTVSSAIRELLDQAKRPGMISLAGGLPDASTFPTAALGDIAAELIHLHGSDVLQYGVTQGEESTRQALSRLFEGNDDAGTVSRRSAIAEHMVVTTGSQQALDLIAQALLDRGDDVVVGDPDYLGALQVFRHHGATLRPVPIDKHGLRTDHLEDVLRRGLRPKACYVVPHFHNPTGVTMSHQRRAHLHELSQHYGFAVIEDDPYRELFFEGARPQDVHGDPELTVRLRSTSKTLAPGLRVGAAVGPSWLTSQMVKVKQSADLHTSTLTQALVARALEASWYPDHLASLRMTYRTKRDALMAAVDANFGLSVNYVEPAGGMFLWASFGRDLDTSEWLVRCLDRGVCFVPGAAFATDRNLSHWARLSYATSSPEMVTEAVGLMAAARP